eukprot:1501629-Pyramimonas_sp.AAC.1
MAAWPWPHVHGHSVFERHVATWPWSRGRIAIERPCCLLAMATWPRAHGHIVIDRAWPHGYGLR